MDKVREIGRQNVVQIKTDNAQACKAAGAIVEGHYPHIFWTPCVVHTLNLALKNICKVKNTEENEMTLKSTIGSPMSAKCHHLKEFYYEPLHEACNVQ